MAKQYITYEPIDWADGVEGGTPVNAGNLGRMEDAIKALVDKVNDPITIDDIGADAIGADQIVDGAVGSNKIANDSVGSEKLTPTLRDSLSLVNLTAVKSIEVARIEDDVPRLDIRVVKDGQTDTYRFTDSGNIQLWRLGQCLWVK